jgi:hypothetical protein
MGSFCELLLRSSLTVSLAPTSARVDEERELALFSLMLAQADAGAATVLVHELDSGSLEGAAYGQIVGRGQGGHFFCALCASNCSQPQGRRPGKLFGTPAQQTARGPYLRAR